jgi:glycosyltransferase involved in cell wall biosynthesis
MQVVLSLDPGGTERLVIDIVKKLRPWTDFSVCCLDRPGSWADELRRCGVPIAAFNRQAGFQPKLGYAIARLARRHAIDVLHCHQYTPFVYGQLAAAMVPGLRIVFTEHGRSSDAGPSLKRRVVNPWLGRFPSAVVAVSADLRRHMIEEGFAASRIDVLHNGIDVGRRPTSVDRFEARAALGLPQGGAVIGAVGRIDPVKDLSTLLDAFGDVRRSHVDARLVVVGQGPDEEVLAARSRSLGLEAAVTFAGYRDDVRRLMPAFDVYANSSIHEGVSLTILEAMAAALPVVATRVGGTPEVVVGGETGLLVPARSPQTLAAALSEVLQHVERGRAMGEAGRFRVKRHFTVDAMASAYLDVYRHVVES